MADELERPAHDVEGDVHGLVRLVGARLRIDLGVGEAPVGIAARHALGVLGQVRPVEPLVLGEREFLARFVLLQGVVAGEVEFADLEAFSLDDRHRDDDAVVHGVHLRLADVDAQEAGVAVFLLDALEILHEDRLGVGAGLVQVLRHVGPGAPRLGAHALAKIALVEVRVALEDDLAELELPALDDLEVHRHGVVRQRLDLVRDRGLVVTLGAVEGLDAVAVLVEQREVQRGARGERQLIADAVALDGVVARDRDLAHHRVLDHLEAEDAPVRRGFGAHAHVLEEAERVDLADVFGDLLRRETIPRLGCDAGANRVGLDAAVAADADLGDALTGLRRLDARVHEAIRRRELEHHGDAVRAALGARRRAGDAGDALQLLEVRLQRVAVVGTTRLGAQFAAHARFVDLRGALEAHRRDAPGHGDLAGDDLDHAIAQFADALEQFRIAVGSEDHGARRNPLTGGRDANVQAVRAGEFGDAALHHPLGADFARQLAQHLVGALAGHVRDQRLAHHDGVDHLDLAAGFEAAGQFVGERGLQLGQRTGAVDLEREHGHQHLDRTRTLRTRRLCHGTEREREHEPCEAKLGLGAQSLPPVRRFVG